MLKFTVKFWIAEALRFCYDKEKLSKELSHELRGYRIHSKHPGVCVLKRRIRFTTVIEFGFAIMFLVVAILWQQS